MKKIIGFIIFIALVGIFACNKDTDEVTNSTFTQAGAEEWFNTTFKESEEWQQNPDSQNKTPDWSNGMYQKKDSLEIFEFPLLENKATITVPQDKSITNSDTKKILDATLLRMAIIKTSTNEIIVRKLYYVPDYKYLLSKGYDISDVMLNKTNDDFTGLLITKNWNDALLSYHKVKNGKIEEILIKYDANNPKNNSLNSIKMNNYATAKTSGLDDEQNLEEVVITNTYHAPATYIYIPSSQPYFPTTSPTSTYNPYGTSGGGGGSTPASSPASVPPAMPPSCQAFGYSKVATSNWQAAATKNIVAVIGYYDLATGEYNIASALYPQPIYFEMPINSPSNGGYISSGRAAELTALAITTAISRAKYYFLSTKASSSQVQAKLWEYIRDEMTNGTHIIGGKASFTPPLGFKGEIKDFKAYWFLPDNCN